MTENGSKILTEYRRFTGMQRIEHALLLVSFTGLALTGIPQKYALTGWADTMIAVMGGIEMVRIIHRVLATLLMALAIYHLVVTAYRMFVLQKPPYMLLRPSDFGDLWSQIKFNLRLTKKRPRMDRFNYEEKIEYWALLWGTVVMIVTGFMLWNPIATTRFVPGQVIPAALAAHGGEAVLAVLSIVTWHMYSVHIRHFNKSMFTGKLDRHTMKAEHSLELERVESGRVHQPPEPEVLVKRLRVFLPVALAVTLILVVGLVMFITFEQTAITTIPPYEIEVVPPELQ